MPLGTCKKTKGKPSLEGKSHQYISTNELSSTSSSTQLQVISNTRGHDDIREHGQERLKLQMWEQSNKNFNPNAKGNKTQALEFSGGK